MKTKIKQGNSKLETVVKNKNFLNNQNYVVRKNRMTIPLVNIGFWDDDVMRNDKINYLKYSYNFLLNREFETKSRNKLMIYFFPVALLIWYLVPEAWFLLITLLVIVFSLSFYYKKVKNNLNIDIVNWIYWVKKDVIIFLKDKEPLWNIKKN